MECHDQLRQRGAHNRVEQPRRGGLEAVVVLAAVGEVAIRVHTFGLLPATVRVAVAIGSRNGENVSTGRQICQPKTLRLVDFIRFQE